MKTAEAAKGRWPEILEHFDLPPITGKITTGANALYAVHVASSALTTATVPGHGSVYVVVAMA